MGSAASGSSGRVLIETPAQVHFANGRVKKDVADLVRGWFEDGAPLGLMQQAFGQLMCLTGKAEESQFFELFDTDHNSKVDALEVLAAAILLGHGTLDEKLETLFPVFDFAGAGRLNFDEANILLHSACRGLRKVCGAQAPAASDEEIVEACRSLFDSHNLAYSKPVTRDQVRRWLRSDRDASAFLDAFQQRLVLAELESQGALREQTQEAALAALMAPAAGEPSSRQNVIASTLAKSARVRAAFGEPSEVQFKTIMDAMASGGGPSVVVSVERYALVARACNAFGLAASDDGSVVQATDLGLLLRLFRRVPPTDEELKAKRELVGETISLQAWLDMATAQE